VKLSRQVIVTAIPIIMVNIAAVIAQYQFIRQHLPTWGIPGQLLLALAIESIAIQLSYFAHLAMIAGDSFAKLRIAALGFAALVALANGSHYLSDGRITFASVAVALCSTSSPILWGIYSRRQSRDKLLSQGLIEGHAVRLGSVRWFYWPGRTLRVFRDAAWSGESNPATAIAEWENGRERTPAAPPPQPERATLATALTKADAVKVALAELGATLAASEVAGWLSARGWAVTPAHVRKVRSELARNGSGTGATVLALPSAGMNGDRNPGRSAMTSNDE
jgi:hypothetical protein